ncbi:MAG: UDP-N-acetylmuramoyl-L-alanine--D-glutamate ligase [Candidatus Dormiibacterota bacterium]
MTALPPSGALALVVGIGRSGLALARHLAGHGIRVRAVDRRPAGDLTAQLIQLPPGTDARTGGYDASALDGCAAVFASPGVPWDAPLLEAARSRGLPVSSEVDLFVAGCPGEIIGVTGTNGKTTTTAMLGEVLREGDRPVLVGGNIGETLLDRLGEITPAHRVVLELSSFQLESIAKPRAEVGIVLNLTPDHLDSHHTMAAYIDAKARLVEGLEPTGAAVLNGGDAACRALAERTPARIVWFDEHQPVPRLRVPGRHNELNALAAAAAARVLGLDDAQIQRGLSRFTGVEHRLELVPTGNGVRWYNDSKATNPEAALPALRSFPDEPVVLIAGGHGSGFELSEWGREVRRTTVAAVLIGESAPLLEELLAGHPVRRAASLEEAVELAASLVPPGGVVLLSPAYKSYDMFHDFEERGRRFKTAVRSRTTREGEQP